MLYQLSYFRDGGHRGPRTPNLRIKNPVLYQLSYMPGETVNGSARRRPGKWLSGAGLNRRPNACHAFALPLSYPTSEKHVAINLVRMAGIEPARPLRAVALCLKEAGLPVPVTCAGVLLEMVPTVGLEPTKRSRADHQV